MAKSLNQLIDTFKIPLSDIRIRRCLYRNPIAFLKAFLLQEKLYSISRSSDLSERVMNPSFSSKIERIWWAKGLKRSYPNVWSDTSILSSSRTLIIDPRILSPISTSLKISLKYKSPLCSLMIITLYPTPPLHPQSRQLSNNKLQYQSEQLSKYVRIYWDR